MGLAWNEVSRRYVDDEPEFYFPKVIQHLDRVVWHQNKHEHALLDWSVEYALGQDQPSLFVYTQLGVLNCADRVLWKGGL